MLTNEPIVAFAATTDAQRAREFYGGVLGLEFVGDEAHALVFRAGPTMLRVQKVDGVADVPYTVLGWEVADLTAAVQHLQQRGVAFLRTGLPGQDERGIWDTGAGARIAWFRDPDGSILSLTQFAT